MFCRTCNSTAHRACVRRIRPKVKLVDTAADFNLVTTFECHNCQESVEADVDYYYKVLDNVTKERMKIQAQAMIDAQMKASLNRQRFLISKKSIIRIQSTYRKYRARKTFFMWRRTQLRVVRIEMKEMFPFIFSRDLYGSFAGADEHGPALPTGMVVLTIIDPIKHLQIMRMEKRLSKAIDEGSMQY